MTNEQTSKGQFSGVSYARQESIRTLCAAYEAGKRGEPNTFEEFSHEWVAYEVGQQRAALEPSTAPVAWAHYEGDQVVAFYEHGASTLEGSSEAGLNLVPLYRHAPPPFPAHVPDDVSLEVRFRGHAVVLHYKDGQEAAAVYHAAKTKGAV
jgi:hypothetical protein